MTSKQTTRRAALALGALSLSGVRAESWPRRPVQLIVPVAPGDPVNDAAEILAAALARRWRQPVQITHVAGDSTIRGTVAVARAQPDGHRLGLATTALAINAALRDSLAYRTFIDLAPVCDLARVQFAIFANVNSPVRSAADLIALARRSAPPLAYASPGVGTGRHLAMESFAFEAGIRLTHVPFPKALDARKAVMEGRIPLLIDSMSSNIAPAGRESLVLVALTGHKTQTPVPVSWLSDVLHGFEIDGTLGLIAPKGVPALLLQQIAQEVTATLSTVEVRTGFARLGMSTVGSTPSEYDIALRADIARWRLVGRATGIRLG